MLLLVAPNEHKVRIEVGYGLEGTLTDALSSVIISSAIIPRFKAGDFSGGIERGVDGIISVLSGDTADWQPKVNVRPDDASTRLRQAVSDLFFVLMFFIMLVLDPSRRRRAGAGRHAAAASVRSIPCGGWGWGVGGGGSEAADFGGGFSGGGGSSGGGGASGGW